jgi:diadenosine tetraphosphate (Ap4A) HIT family hydrolase
MDGCLVCREIAGEVELPGGLLWDDEHVVAFHLPPLEGNPSPYLGHCMVATRRHVDLLGDLTADEAAAVGRASQAIASALQHEGVARVHVAVIGLGVPHFHQHLFPRYPGMEGERGWTELDEHPDAPHGGPDEIGALVARLKEHLR